MKTIVWLLLMATTGTRLVAAETINVRDFEIFPGTDVSMEVNRLIESLNDRPGVILKFPKGKYLFHPENALEVHRSVSNHDNSLKRIAFPLFGSRDLTIDGGGSEFIFHGRIVPFVLDGAEGVTLKSFSIDWARSFHDELKVVESDADDRSFTVEVDPERYPYRIHHGQYLSQKHSWEEPMGSNMVFDPKTRAPIHNTRDYSINFQRPYLATQAGKNLVRFKTSFRKSPPPVGSVLISYGVHPTSRLCPAIHVAESRDIRIENVTIHEAGGMGVIAERTENVHLDGVQVTSSEGRFVSTRADATHFIGCKGTITIENCLFEHMLDDATNVHGAYVKVMKRLDGNDFLCEISHFQQWGLTFAGVGDKVALLSRETVLPFHETEVTAVRVLNEHRFVLSLRDLPAELPDVPLSLENLSWYPDLVMRDNIVRENRARSVLVTTKGKVLIEGNYFSSQMHGILIEGDNNVWYESGGVEDVLIRDNHFVNTGYEGTDRYPLFATPLLTGDQRMGEGAYHRNIRFENNRIRSFNGHLVHAASIEGLVITGNIIEHSSGYPAMEVHPSVSLSYCEKVLFKNNRAEGFAEPLEFKTTSDCSKVLIEENKGFELEKAKESPVSTLPAGG